MQLQGFLTTTLTGILLHGPPGTGKTLIARKIAEMLNGHKPQVHFSCSAFRVCSLRVCVSAARRLSMARRSSAGTHCADLCCLAMRPTDLHPLHLLLAYCARLNLNDRFVGAAEEAIRKLFEPAEKEYRERGDASKLHVIIFDEIDAICKVWTLC